MSRINKPLEICDGNNTILSIETVEEDELLIHGQRFTEFQRQGTGRRIMDEYDVSYVAQSPSGERKDAVAVLYWEEDRLGTGKHAWVGAPSINYQYLIFAASEFNT